MKTVPLTEAAAETAREDAAAFGITGSQIRATDGDQPVGSETSVLVRDEDSLAAPSILAGVEVEDIRKSLPLDVSKSIPLNVSRIVGANQTMTQAGAAAQPEILPGYKLIKSIGSGGFGEVFECDAPGGLKKAVKVVFGTLDEQRAERELTALSRIKEVRHPFLVGLERIEIVNEQLVIVSELADRSLKERYLEAREQKLSGIPREELLVYMRDAAEALDYLYEKHTLQHLDVKPENLLLLGDHLKVADFGLLKDLRDTQMSMVGGVTPLYAPPEVLDGRPNRHSDQYSLAIVFQEMLTGEAPFNGRTAGQLAAQHMHSAPVLAGLPTADRYAVGRALSKSPGKRFASNREFVDALVNPPSRAYRRPTTDDGDGETFESAAADAVRSNSPLMRTEIRATRALPPMDLAEEVFAGPTVVIGVGGLGGSVVADLKHRLCERFGRGASVPAVQLLYIDTNREDVSLLCRREDGSSLTPDETCSAPLRAATEYRSRREVLLPWLSRRWLYNVPRSLETEGIRPLGRLAFVDHAKTIKAKVSAAITRAADPDSARTSTASTGTAFAERAPRVFIVGAIGGGTAGGMMTDLGYYARQCLRDAKLAEEVVGVMLHGTGVRGDERDLADVNAVSSLGELYHFSRHDTRYPGDAGADLKPAAGEDAPYRSSYYVHLGERLTAAGFESAAFRVSDYLLQNIVAGEFFDRSRADAAGEEAVVRGFGVGVLGGLQSAALPTPDVLCDAMLGEWVTRCETDLNYGGGTGPDATNTPAMQKAAAAMLAELDLTPGESADTVVDLDELNDRCGGLIADAWQATAGEAAASRTDAMFVRVEESLSAERAAGGPVADIAARVAARTEGRRDERMRRIREAIFTPPVDGVPGLEDALGMMFCFVRRTVDCQQAADTRARQRRTELDSLRRQGCPTVKRGKGCPDDVAAFLTSYCELRLRETAEQARAAELQSLLADIVSTSQLFDQVRRSLSAARGDFGNVSDGRAAVEPGLLKAFEQRVRHDVLRRVGPFWPMVVGDPKHRGGFVAALRQAAEDAISECCLAVATAASGGEGSDDPVADARPTLPCRPADVRWLLSGPSEASVKPIADRIERQFGSRPTFRRAGDGRVTLICEAENLPIANVAAGLVGNRSDHLETAGRVRTRMDIDWKC